MEIVVTIFAILGCIILILLSVALFIPRHYSVSVSVSIDKPSREVFDYVRFLKYQLDYSEWLKHDPQIRSEVTGVDGTIGATLKWESVNRNKNINTGAGEQEIKILNDSQIEIELRLIKPQPAVCKIENRLVENGPDKTLLSCAFYAYAKYPINLPAYVLGRRFIRTAQLKTLHNIKTILEEGIKLNSLR